VEVLRSPEQVSALPSCNLKRQLVLVTGAQGGIGRAICTHLRNCNARVVALDLGKVHDLVAELGLFQGICVDLQDIDQVAAEVNKFMDGHGPIPLLVNCAGLAKFEPYWETSPSEFDRQYTVNVKAPFFLTQIITQRCAAAGLPGSVVHLSSQSSTLALRDHLVYSSGKAALDHAARIQALELGSSNIRVNTVRPTVVMTPLAQKAWDPEKLEIMKASIPLQKLADPNDVAQATAWLLSDQSRLVTGTTIAVDGGRSMGGYGL